MTTQIDIDSFLQLDRILKIKEKLFEYARKFGGKFPNDEERYAEYLIEKYSVNTSVLMGVLGDDVSGKRILEVGPGYAGRFMLDYLAEEGADAIGTDPYYDYGGYSGPSQGRYISSPMEKLSEAVNAESVDLINIMSMYPDPCPIEIKRMQHSGSFFQRLKANRYYRRYPMILSDEINQILKNKGHVLLWSRPHSDDFRFNPANLSKKDFSHQTIPIPKGIMPVAFDLEIYQKHLAHCKS